MELNERAQVSIEIILITLIVMMLTFIIVSFAFNHIDSTKAISLIKTSAIAKTQSLNEVYYLKEITFKEQGNSINLTLDFEPNLPEQAIDLSEAIQLIVNETKYDEVNLTFS